MELQVLKGDTIPIRGIQSEDRSTKVEHELYPFLKALLSLDNSEKNIDRLPSILLMIEKSAYSMTFSQIKEAFIKYVNHELPGLTPRSNYLDGVLFSSVMQAYKNSRPQPKSKEHKVELSEEEIKKNAYLNCVYAFDEFLQNKELKYHYWTAYDTLKEKGISESPTKKKSDEVLKIAKSRLIRECSTNKSMRETLRGGLNKPEEKEGEVN